VFERERELWMSRVVNQNSEEKEVMGEGIGESEIEQLVLE